MDTYPSSDDVARAVLAACKVTGADVVEVLSGVRVRGGCHGKYTLSRARDYAAIALQEMFDCGSTAISRMVGATSPESHLAALHHRLKNGQAPWFDPGVVVSIKLAVRAHQTLTLKPVVKVTPEKVIQSPVLTQEQVRSKPPVTFMGLVAYNDRPTHKKQEELKKKHDQEFSGPLIMRKKAVPAHQCEDQTAYYMGDPPQSRSALSDFIAQEISRQVNEG